MKNSRDWADLVLYFIVLLFCIIFYIIVNHKFKQKKMKMTMVFMVIACVVSFIPYAVGYDTTWFEKGFSFSSLAGWTAIGDGPGSLGDGGPFPPMTKIFVFCPVLHLLQLVLFIIYRNKKKVILLFTNLLIFIGMLIIVYMKWNNIGELMLKMNMSQDVLDTYIHYMFDVLSIEELGRILLNEMLLFVSIIMHIGLIKDYMDDKAVESFLAICKDERKK